MRSLALAAALLIGASPAFAAEPSARLEVSPTLEGCPDALTLSNSINAILGRAALGDSSTGPTISVSFLRIPGGFGATLTLHAADGSLLGTRELHRPGRSCAALEGPVAVVGALLVDITRDSIQLQIPPPSPAERAAVVEAEAEAPPPRPSPVVRQAPRWSLQGEIAATMLLGLLPGWAPGVRSDLRAARGGAIAGAMRLDFWPSRSSSGAGPGGDFSAGAVSLGGCVASRSSSALTLEGCGMALLGGLQGVGRGTSEVRTSRTWLALGVLDGALRGHLAGPLGWRLSLGIAAGQRPGRFVFEGPGQTLVVHQTWPVALQGALGLVFDERSEIPALLRHFPTNVFFVLPAPVDSPAPSSIHSVYEQHAAYVLRCLRYLGVPSADLDDSLQEVFLVVHRRLDSFQGGSFRSWLYAITLNVVRHFRRRRRVGASLSEIPEPETHERSESAVEARMELLSLLAHLDEEKREVVVLYHLEQLTLQEIADATEAPLQTVHSRLKAGIRRLEEVRACAGKDP